MEENITNRVEGLTPPQSSIVAVAITRNRKSKYIVKWALEKFVPEGEVCFKLLHVRPVITRIPTPMGNFIPISQVRGDVASAFRKEVEWQTSEKLLPYKKMCTQKMVQVEIVQIESDDVVTAISLEISKCKINKLVIGASSHSFFSRAKNLSSKIAECCPTFCTVYAVSKGKLSSLRPSDSETKRSITDESSDRSSTNNSSSRTSSSQTEWMDKGSTGSFANFCSASLPVQRFQALSNINQNLLQKRTPSSVTTHSKNLYSHVEDEGDGSSSYPGGLDANDTISEASSFTSFVTDNPSRDQVSTSDALTETSESQANINFELEKLRTELRHVRGMYVMAQTEVIDASRKISDLQKRRMEEGIKLKQISFKEEEAKCLARQEKEKYEAAKDEAEYVTECAEREAAERKEAESRALREAKEKEKLENALTGSTQLYQKFTWEEIVSATSSFSEHLKIGMGAYGTVYKCSFHHTVAAVKILHSKEASRIKQFQQELEILSNIRHPHLLILLGACPERGCLVYEFMENGSLEDRLLRRNNTPPLSWFQRYRIAWEVASALVFLHNSKPKPIIHRDLKPANILLDHNNVSKIGDIGLSTVVHSDSSSISATYKDTALAGTLSYIDPEYQRTGVVSLKSDVYAFGMVILQLLTAKPAMALAYKVEIAMDEDCLADVLDPEAGAWPIEETKNLAVMALICTEIRRKDRPDLKDQVLPVLEKLKEVVDRAQGMASVARPLPPNHFICPILEEVMSDPCVAADGYSYERKATEEWLEGNDKSPVTNLPLLHKSLIPNYTLLSAIMEWKSAEE